MIGWRVEFGEYSLVHDRRLSPERFLFRWEDDRRQFQNLGKDQKSVRSLDRKFLRAKPRLDSLRPEVDSRQLSAEQLRALDALGYREDEDEDEGNGNR